MSSFVIFRFDSGNEFDHEVRTCCIELGLLVVDSSNTTANYIGNGSFGISVLRFDSGDEFRHQRRACRIELGLIVCKGRKYSLHHGRKRRCHIALLRISRIDECCQHRCCG